MKLALFGATGLAGRYILDEALKAGHYVTVLVRDASKIDEPHKNLKIVTGDALKEEDVFNVVKDQDAIVSTISEGPNVQHKTQRVATDYMIKAMQKTGVQRILCMGAIGILQFNASELIRDQPFYPELYRPLSYEHSAVNKLLHQSGLKWTQVCASTILAVPSDGKYALRVDYPPRDNMDVNAGNIGLFIMRELNKNEYLGKRVGITNA